MGLVEKAIAKLHCGGDDKKLSAMTLMQVIMAIIGPVKVSVILNDELFLIEQLVIGGDLVWACAGQ